MSNIRVTGFKWVPPFAQGLVRDLRVRWALEEAGLPYEEKLLGQGEQNSAEHRAVQPFGQVPVYQEGDLTLFESGSIVLHIAEKSPLLLPTDPAARGRVITWMFAALNSVEPHLLTLAALDTFFAKEEWARLRKPSALAMAQTRLANLAAGLGDREYFEQRFSAADVLMTTVLRFIKHTPLVAEIPTLAAYQARCEARPAFKRALAAQLAPFAKYAPAAA
jgi:glutathione S-transferase